jgi:hypothetical protein
MSYFNRDQEEYMADLARVPREQKCPSGWHVTADEKCDCKPRPAASPVPPSAPSDERIYPCLTCDAMRTKAEGGTTFTYCEECMKRVNQPPAAAPVEGAIPTEPYAHLHDERDNRIRHLESENARLLNELAEAKRDYEDATSHYTENSLRGLLAKAERRLAGYREVVERYVRHASGCSIHDEARCDCGLTAALASLSPSRYQGFVCTRPANHPREENGNLFTCTDINGRARWMKPHSEEEVSNG